MISPQLTRRIPKPHPLQKCRRDPQASRVYILERAYIGVCVYHTVTRENLQIVADHACRYYRVSPVRIETYGDEYDGTMAECIWTEHDDGRYVCHKIRVNRARHGANVTCLLHELAHHVTHSTYINIEGHGPEFVGIYMHLLDKYRIMPSCAFRVLAKKHRVRIAGQFKPGAIRG